MMGCHQNRDVLLNDQGTTFQSVFVNKNNYLMKYWILFGSGAPFHYEERVTFLSCCKKVTRREAKP
jgi:hypothetical protein